MIFIIFFMKKKEKKEKRIETDESGEKQTSTNSRYLGEKLASSNKICFLVCFSPFLFIFRHTSEKSPTNMYPHRLNFCHVNCLST